MRVLGTVSRGNPRDSDCGVAPAWNTPLDVRMAFRFRSAAAEGSESGMHEQVSACRPRPLVEDEARSAGDLCSPVSIRRAPNPPTPDTISPTIHNSAVEGL